MHSDNFDPDVQHYVVYETIDVHPWRNTVKAWQYMRYIVQKLECFRHTAKLMHEHDVKYTLTYFIQDNVSNFSRVLVYISVSEENYTLLRLISNQNFEYLGDRLNAFG